MCKRLGGIEALTQTERRRYLLETLIAEQPKTVALAIPANESDQKTLLRSLLNIRMPRPVSDAFLAVQDAYLQEEIRQKGITSLDDLSPVRPDLYIWQGDITTLRCDAIVNAANSRMLGCFVPGHGCVDNAIHTFAGVQLRAACADQMRRSDRPRAADGAMITPGFNLPCRFVLHTVGPIVQDRVTHRDMEQLAACYRSCLDLAEQHGVTSLAFCCISTGEFHFPNHQAAEIAIRAVTAYKEQTRSQMKVIFNVFKKIDWSIYRQLLGADGTAEKGNRNC